MRWESGRRSTNVEDRRGMGGAGMVGGGGIGMLILVLIISFISGTNPLELLQQVEQSAPPGSSAPAGPPAADDPQAQMVSAVLADTEDTWRQIFRANGGTYQEPVLVLFDGQVRSACGLASSAVGPFYCPGDQSVYLDLSFFRELDQRFGAPGEFAAGLRRRARSGSPHADAAGHIEPCAGRAFAASEAEANELSVRQELQADCYAGVWGNHAGAKLARARRRRRRLARGGRHRRRSAAAAEPGLRGAGELHARLLGAAAAVAAARAADRRHPAVRHVRRRDLLAAVAGQLTRSSLARSGARNILSPSLTSNVA